MLARRAALIRAAGLAAAPLLATAARAEEAMEIVNAVEADLSSLPRRRQKLVAPASCIRTSR
jgi:nitrite reductase (NO-forming)